MDIRQYLKSEDTLGYMLQRSKTLRSILLGKDSGASGKLYKKWRNSLPCLEIERLLSGSDLHISDGESLFPETEDITDSDILATILGTETSSSTASVGNLYMSDQTTQDTQAQPNLTSPVNQIPDDSGPKHSNMKDIGLKLPANMWHLFDMYFAYNHCWLPIAEKHDILKTAYSYPDDGLKITAEITGSGDHAELWAVLALASFHDYANFITSRQQDGAYPLETSPREMYTIARHLIPTELGQCEIGHVKALLLLAMVNLGSQNLSAVWLLVGYAVRVAIDLGLHLETGVMDNRNVHHQKHVFFACFTLDTLISAHLCREPHLRGHLLAGLEMLQEDGLEEWNPWISCSEFGSAHGQVHQSLRKPVCSLSIFTQLTRLMDIVNQYICLPQPPHQPQYFSARLEEWASKLPPHNFLSEAHLKQCPSPPLICLRLAFLSAKICYCPCDRLISAQFTKSLELFSISFGLSAVPPSFQSFIAIAARNLEFQVSDSRAEDHILKTMSNLSKIWARALTEEDRTPCLVGSKLNHRPTQFPITSFDPIRCVGMVDPAQHILPRRLIEHGLPQHSSTPTPITYLEPAQASTSRTAVATSIPQPQRLLSHPQIAPQAPPTTQHIANIDDELPQLGNFNAATSIDLDSVFDELASLDKNESLENHPQFMRNHGFAPNADLTDVLASDYAQLNPLLIAYMQQGAIGPDLVTQAPPFDSG